MVGVSASYGRLRALDPIDVSVQPGGLVLVVGPNGAGKSTLLRTLAGLIQKSQEDVILGRKNLSLSRSRRRNGSSGEQPGG